MPRYKQNTFQGFKKVHSLSRINNCSDCLSPQHSSSRGSFGKHETENANLHSLSDLNFLIDLGAVLNQRRCVIKGKFIKSTLKHLYDKVNSSEL